MIHQPSKETIVSDPLEDFLDAPDAEGWRPEPGDKLVGTIADVSRRLSDYGQGEYPIVTIRTDDGRYVAIHGFHSMLRNELEAKHVVPGDRLGVKYQGKVEPNNGGMAYEKYKVAHQAGAGPSARARPHRHRPWPPLPRTAAGRPAWGDEEPSDDGRARARTPARARPRHPADDAEEPRLPNPLHETAHAAHQVGACVLPASRRRVQAPRGEWKRYQHERPTLEQLDTWFADGRHPGLGVVCGATSANLEMLELEGRAVADGGLLEVETAIAAAGLGDLYDDITLGYLERTPSGGLHWLYRVDGTVPGNTKIAQQPIVEPPFVEVLAETRGEGGWTVIAPASGATHLTGRPWQLLNGGWDTIATITVDQRTALHRCFATLDRMPPANARQADHVAAGASERPGDRWNALPDIQERMLELVQRHGWVVAGRHRHADGVLLRRPGKDHGFSATLGHIGPGVMRVFTTSTTLDARAYDPFGLYAALEHGGDLARAGRALLEQLGDGRPPRAPSAPGPGPSSAAGTTPRERPSIVINGRPLRDITRDVTEALLEANDPPRLFVRAGALVRVRRDENLRPLIDTLGESELPAPHRRRH
ncbi:MAG: hypothetical protein QM757_14790 [Paludibaculum sp.]